MTLSRLAVFLALPVVLACPLSASPPALSTPPVKWVQRSGHFLAPDTMVATFTCTAGAPDTACVVTARDSIAHTTLASSVSVAVGSTTTFAIVCQTPTSPVLLGVSLFGIAPSVPQSATVFGSAGATCIPHAAVSPTFTITVTVHPGG